MKTLGTKTRDHFDVTTADVCNSCGWWLLENKYSEINSMDQSNAICRAAGQLKKLDVSDVSAPSEELRRYLLAKKETRFDLNPKRFEDIVAGIFRDFDYRVRVTSYSGDEGIDIVALEGNAGKIVGVQVKRYKNKIEAEQIRAFVGALKLKGITEGVFVTTSSFRSGAKKTAREAHDIGTPVTLWDGDVFLDKLQIAQAPAYSDLDDEEAPFHNILESDSRGMTCISHESWTFE